jgi:hypothetical protein
MILPRSRIRRSQLPDLLAVPYAAFLTAVDDSFPGRA